MSALCYNRNDEKEHERTMKLISWNVNGIRACKKKGFDDFFQEIDADLFCIQESKMQEGQADIDMPGYNMYLHSALRKGYSGVITYTKEAPLSVQKGIGDERFDEEGRALTLEFKDFYSVNVYVPNSQEKLVRLPYRLSWEECFLAYVKKLEQKKPVIICGDMNVAKEEIDLKNPKSNHLNPGFSDAEREKMRILQNSGFIDTYRYFYPDKENAYTWWSYRFQSRMKDSGWRIDYFLVSQCLKERLMDAIIHKEVMGSDHCPIELDIS